MVADGTKTCCPVSRATGELIVELWIGVSDWLEKEDAARAGCVENEMRRSLWWWLGVVGAAIGARRLALWLAAAGEVRKGGKLGLLITGAVDLALCLANRRMGVRAVRGADSVVRA